MCRSQRHTGIPPVFICFSGRLNCNPRGYLTRYGGINAKLHFSGRIDRGISGYTDSKIHHPINSLWIESPLPAGYGLSLYFVQSTVTLFTSAHYKSRRLRKKADTDDQVPALVDSDILRKAFRKNFEASWPLGNQMSWPACAKCCAYPGANLWWLLVPASTHRLLAPIMSELYALGIHRICVPISGKTPILMVIQVLKRCVLIFWT